MNYNLYSGEKTQNSLDFKPCAENYLLKVELNFPKLAESIQNCVNVNSYSHKIDDNTVFRNNLNKHIRISQVRIA